MKIEISNIFCKQRRFYNGLVPSPILYTDGGARLVSFAQLAINIRQSGNLQDRIAQSVSLLTRSHYQERTSASDFKDAAAPRFDDSNVIFVYF